MEFNSSYMVHERPEGLQHENKYLLITCLQCLAHFTRRRRLYLRVVSAKFGLRDDLRLGQINLDFCLRVGLIPRQLQDLKEYEQSYVSRTVKKQTMIHISFQC